MLSIFARVAGAFVERSVARSTNEVIIEPHNARNQAEKSRIGKKCLENRQNVLIFELMAVPLQDSINMINICKVSWPSTCQYIVNICSRSEQYSISIYRRFLSIFCHLLIYVSITEAPGRGGVGNPRGLTETEAGPGLAPGRDSLRAARARGVDSLPRVAPNPGTHLQCWSWVVALTSWKCKRRKKQPKWPFRPSCGG